MSQEVTKIVENSMTILKSPYLLPLSCSESVKLN